MSLESQPTAYLLSYKCSDLTDDLQMLLPTLFACFKLFKKLY